MVVAHEPEAVHGVNPCLPHAVCAGVPMDVEAERLEEGLPIEDAVDQLNVLLVSAGRPHLVPDHAREVGGVLRQGGGGMGQLLAQKWKQQAAKATTVFKTVPGPPRQ